MKLSFFSLFLCFFIYSGCSFKASGSEKTVEEGWRYSANLKVCLMDNESKLADLPQNFIPSVHSMMAQMVRTAGESYKNEGFPNQKDRMFCSFRFTPIMEKDGVYSAGKTIRLDTNMTDEELIPDGVDIEEQFAYEYLFVSGFYPFPETKVATGLPVSGYDAYYEDSTVKKGAFVKLHGLRSAPFPYKFLMRNYMDPEKLKNNIQTCFIDIPTDSILRRENYQRIKNIHEKTLETLNVRNDNINEAFKRAADKAKTTDIADILTELNNLLIPQRREVGSNVSAGSYTCAEQVGLDFMATTNIMEKIRQRANIEHSCVKGMIAHLHTSETPCGTCSPLLTRACESDGFLKNLFLNKPVFLINTTSNHYQRPEQQIPYEHTQFLANIVIDPISSIATSQPINFNLTDSSKNLPYPTIIYKPIDISRKNSGYDVDNSRYKYFCQK